MNNSADCDWINRALDLRVISRSDDNAYRKQMRKVDIKTHACTKVLHKTEISRFSSFSAMHNISLTLLVRPAIVSVRITNAPEDVHIS